MLYSKGGIYHAIYHWYIAIYKVVYTLLFNTAPLLCYKLFNTARCYVTSYLTLLYNMLNHTFWPERALPACLSTTPPFWRAPAALNAPLLLSSVYSPSDKAMASSSSPSASSSGSPSAPAAPFSGSLLLPALGAEVRETWWTRPWACAPRIGRSAGPLSCQGPCNPWRSARPTFSSSLSSRSWMLYTPRLQCWPQSSWRYTRSWEAQWSAWRPCWLGNPKRWTSRRCSRILGQSTSRFTSCLSWKRFVRKAKIASMKIACRYKPCLFLSRRTLHAISSLDRSTSETLKDKNIYLACFFNKSHLTEAHKGISLLYLNWNNWRWSTFQKETLD